MPPGVYREAGTRPVVAALIPLQGFSRWAGELSEECSGHPDSWVDEPAPPTPQPLHGCAVARGIRSPMRRVTGTARRLRRDSGRPRGRRGWSDCRAAARSAEAREREPWPAGWPASPRAGGQRGRLLGRRAVSSRFGATWPERRGSASRPQSRRGPRRARSGHPNFSDPSADGAGLLFATRAAQAGGGASVRAGARVRHRERRRRPGIAQARTKANRARCPGKLFDRHPSQLGPFDPAELAARHADRGRRVLLAQPSLIAPEEDLATGLDDELS